MRGDEEAAAAVKAKAEAEGKFFIHLCIHSGITFESNFVLKEG